MGGIWLYWCVGKFSSLKLWRTGNGKGCAMAQWDEQFSKLKQIIEMMKDHNLAEITIKQGEEELCVKKAQPAQQQITAVPMFGGMPGMMPGGGRAGGAG